MADTACTGFCNGASALVEKAWYNTYGASERSNARQRYFRSLTPSQWQQIYGRRYMYASDFIHANPKAFKPFVGHSARLANRTEEFAEVLFRYTSVWARITTASCFMALRELSGIPRFSRLLAKQLEKVGKAGSFSLGQEALPINVARDIASTLRQAGVINLRGSVVQDLASTDGLLTSILEKVVDGWKDMDPAKQESCVQELKTAILKSDRRLKTVHMSRAAKIGMAVGCALSAASFAVMYMGVATLVQGALATWYCKMGMVAASLYLSAFLLRCATTILARSLEAYSGMPERYRTGQRQPYRSLFDIGGLFLRRGRNAVYRSVYKYIDPDNPNRWMTASNAFSEADRESEIRRADQEVSELRYDKNVNCVARGLMSASTWLSRATDVIYCMDRIVCQTLVSRPLKTGFFKYASEVSHFAGKGPAPACTADITYTKADNTRWGRFRKATASFIGHGGADCLGMAVGCGACSATWTALGKATGGGMFAIPLTADLVATVGLGFSSVCSPGWAGSALLDLAGRGVNGVFPAKVAS